MKMFRIAHKITARGVYSHNSYCYLESLPYEHPYLEDISTLHGSYENTKRTPCRGYDVFISSSLNPLVDNTTKYIYGFNTLDDLKRWFSIDERTTLKGLGFHVLELEVEEYALYTRQMITPLEHFKSCVLINTLPLQDI